MIYTYTPDSPSQKALPTPDGQSKESGPHLGEGVSESRSPYDVSEWEKTNNPEIIYRSDLFSNPFPEPGAPVPKKSPHGVFNTPLKAVWDSVCPKIAAIIKEKNIRVSCINTARFFTYYGDDEGGGTLGPVTIWIFVHPSSTTAKMAHDASLEILALLEDNGVKDAVVEWWEGVVQWL